MWEAICAREGMSPKLSQDVVTLVIRAGAIKAYLNGLKCRIAKAKILTTLLSLMLSENILTITKRVKDYIKKNES